MFVKGMLFMEENILIKLNFKDLKEFMSLIENNKAIFNILGQEIFYYIWYN